MLRVSLLSLACLALSGCAAPLVGAWSMRTSDCTSRADDGAAVTLAFTNAPDAGQMNASVSTSLGRPSGSCTGQPVTMDRDVEAASFTYTETCGATAVSYVVDVALDANERLAGTITVGEHSCSIASE